LKNGRAIEAFGEEFGRASRRNRLRSGQVQDARRRVAQFQRAQRVRNCIILPDDIERRNRQINRPPGVNLPRDVRQRAVAEINRVIQTGCYPSATSCFASSNVARLPLCIAAMVMHNAIEWLYPASIPAIGDRRLRTHSIQLPICATTEVSALVFESACSAPPRSLHTVFSVNVLALCPAFA